jgi:hypothetical protein
MTSPVSQKIADDVMALPSEDRLAIATQLWRSLDGTNEIVADLTAAQRADDLAKGRVKPATQSEVFRNARAALG